MRYAFISDIHGNLPAFEAVLADAASQGADHLCLLGDYIQDLPFPNEVVNMLRALDNATVIAGNKEAYLLHMCGQDPATWIHYQFAPLYWNYHALSQDNLHYLTALPATACLTTPSGQAITLVHSSPIFYRTPKIDLFRSPFYGSSVRKAPMTHEQYLEKARRMALEHPHIPGELAGLPNGINAFGHNHLQWHMMHDGVLHVNPGSCGIPADCNPGAPYTLVDDTPDGFILTERRVSYDIEAALRCLKQSTLYEEAEIWSRIIMKQLRTAEDHISPFLIHAHQHAGTNDPLSQAQMKSAANAFSQMDIWTQDA